MNLPVDRMVMVKSANLDGDILINVDEIVYVCRYDERPQIYMTDPPHPYNRGLLFTLKSGEKVKVETRMTLPEFDVDRVKKFIPEWQPYDI